jgi:ribosomal-protein-alanine N-acetyltransferase
VLRAPTTDDLAALAAFLPAVLPGNWSLDNLRALQAGDRLLRVLVVPAGAQQEVAGFAECQLVLDEGHLLNIAIAPAWQRRGLGTLLLASVLAELQTLGCSRCLLEVRRANDQAVRLYERAGFRLDGVRKDYYPAPATAGGEREDALLYSWSPGPSP